MLSAIVFYAFLCQLQAVVIVVLMFLASTSVEQLGMIWLAAFVVRLSRNGLGRARWLRSQRRVDGACAAIVVALTVPCVVLQRSTEAGSFVLALGTLQIAAWLATARSRIRGTPEPRSSLELVPWVVGAWVAAYLVSIQVVVAVGILQLLRNWPIMSRPLRRGGLVPWQVGVAVGFFGLLGAQIAHTVQSMPSACEPALRDESTLSVADDDAVLTIAALGDSSMYGILLPARVSYPTRLEARRRAARPDVPLRVINCSSSGPTSDHGGVQLDDALRYRPALVTIALGDNDELGSNDSWAATDPEQGPVAVSRNLERNLTALPARCRSADVLPSC